MCYNENEKTTSCSVAHPNRTLCKDGLGTELAKMIAKHWLTAEFEGGRHQRRVDMITRIENGEAPEA